MQQREIKFRVWDKLNKLWVAGWSIGQLGVVSDDETIVFMQFTGLHDKNGKEIYEGDIVKHSKLLAGRDRINIVGKIEWDTDSLGFSIVSGEEMEIPHPQLTEVIGNIYENPELITTPNSEQPQ